MSGTRAVTAEQMRQASMSFYGNPLCPSCHGGYLHPYKVEIMVGSWKPYYGANYLVGWVAVCRGNIDYKRAWRQQFPERAAEMAEIDDLEPCGFSLPMTPHLNSNRSTQ